MTPDAAVTRDVLKAGLRANKRALALLDKQISQISEFSDDAHEHQPFIYVAEGADGAPGIVLASATVGFSNPGYGYIRMQSDAAFVCTHLFCVAQVAVSSTQYIWSDSSISETRSSLSFGFRLVDESSQRLITLSRRDNSPDSTYLPASFAAQDFFFNQGSMRLVEETAFPRNALVRVEGYKDFTGTATRLWVGLGGYKVFGG